VLRSTRWQNGRNKWKIRKAAGVCRRRCDKSYISSSTEDRQRVVRRHLSRHQHCKRRRGAFCSRLNMVWAYVRKTYNWKAFNIFPEHIQPYQPCHASHSENHRPLIFCNDLTTAVLLSIFVSRPMNQCLCCCVMQLSCMIWDLLLTVLYDIKSLGASRVTGH